MLKRRSKLSTKIENKVKKKKDFFENQIFKREERRSVQETAWRRLYHKERYRRFRRQFMALHPLCVKCGKPATDLDHIEPHRGDANLFWNQENWQALCHKCHSRKTQQEVSERERKKKAEVTDGEEQKNRGHDV